MEKRHTIYGDTVQPFTTTITDDQGNVEIVKDRFRKREIIQDMIINDKAIVVILDDGTKGVAKCDPDDNYNETVGIKIAYLRAKINSLASELTDLTGVKHEIIRTTKKI